MTRREFFSTRTLEEVRAGFLPTRRTATEVVGLADLLGRVPAGPVSAAAPLPGFARSTVDGYAVRASDTYGASEGVPAILRVTGSVSMGRTADDVVEAGAAVEIPTGGAIPQGGDAVVMIEHTDRPAPDLVEVMRPVAPGEHLVAADEDVVAGATLVPAGRPLRPQDLALLAAAGITRVSVHAPPRVAIVSTGDEIVDPSTSALRPGQVRDATASGVAGLVTRAGGTPLPLGVVPDNPALLRRALDDALSRADLVVISAGSSVGGRDVTAEVIAEVAAIWCHGIALRPGKPTVLAGATSTPVLGLPGNPLSALVVFELVGVPLVWRLAGCLRPPTVGGIAARLTEPVASASGRTDVVQVTLDGDRAVPLHGPSALLSRLGRADGYVMVEQAQSGLAAGAEVMVIPHC